MKLFLKEEQISAMFAAAAGHPRDLALLWVMVSTGLRMSDILRLKRCDVTTPSEGIVHAIRLKQKKTKQMIDCRLRQEARVALDAYLSIRRDRSDWLFVSLSHNSIGRMVPLGRRGAQDIVRGYIEKLGYPESLMTGAATHTLRRSIAKIISLKTGRIESASAFLGHKNVASTMTYIDGAHFEAMASEAVEGLKL